MHSHLDIKVNGKSLVIPDDSSLSVEEKNPMFNDVTFFSYPMQIPVEGNREVLKNIAHRDSDMRAMDLEHAAARIFADGLPLNHGQVITQDGSEIKDTFEFNIDAQQQSFDELIGDLECQDVKVKDRLVIGEKIGAIRAKGTIRAQELITCSPNYPDYPSSKVVTLDSDVDCIIDSPQALGFSYPGICVGFPSATVDSNGRPMVSKSYINVSKPYPFPYCNARVAYAHPDVKENDDGTLETEGTVKGNDKGTEPEDFGQYWCLDADRPQSGICFYVLYFLDCLFEQLGVSFDKSELLEIEDFSRLVFFSTQCCYDEEPKHYNVSYHNGDATYSSWANALAAVPDDDKKPNMDVVYKTNTGSYVRYTPLTVEWSDNPSDWRGPLTAEILVNDEINEWLNSRNCGGNINLLVYTGKTKDTYGQRETVYGEWNFTGLEESYPVKIYNEDEHVYEPLSISQEYSSFETWGLINEDRLGWHKHTASRILSADINYSTEICYMIANSKNFPQKSVSSVISSLEASFGIRFVYDTEKRSVTAKLMRNVYKRAETRVFNGKVLSMTPVNEKITGVRMLYSAESEKKEQQNNVRNGIKDYDTEFDYIEYPKEKTVTSKTYQQMVSEQGIVTSTNRNVYVDERTGNSYRIKIDADAESISLLRPVLFQVAQYKGIEIGDCSEQNKDYVKEFVSDFRPLTSSVINAKDYNSDKSGTVDPIFAPLLEVDMESEKVENTIQMDAHSFGSMVYPDDFKLWVNPQLTFAFPEEIHLLVELKLKLSESYDPTQTETGNSPLQDIDWGLTLCVMRGGGSDASIINFDQGYDGFGNSRWKTIVGTYEMYSDSLDLKGSVFDYNGTDEDDGGGERFSLQIRSWVKPEWAESPLCDEDMKDGDGRIIKKIRSRGLCDTFMTEHIHALLHRKLLKVKVLATVAQLLDIRNHWEDKYVFDGKVGFVNIIKYNIEKATGVSEAELEFYAL